MFEYMIDPEPLTDEQRISEFEEMIGNRLPSDYHMFLLQHNGGRPFPSCFPILGMPNNPFGMIQWFYGLGTSMQCYDLTWSFGIGKNSYPPDCIAIACTPSGDELLLDLNPKSTERLLFWNYYYGYDLKEQLYLVAAESFEQLLYSLFEEPAETE